jgi:hypothetical protein
MVEPVLSVHYYIDTEIQEGGVRNMEDDGQCGTFVVIRSTGSTHTLQS